MSLHLQFVSIDFFVAKTGTEKAGIVCLWLLVMRYSFGLEFLIYQGFSK